MWRLKVFLGSVTSCGRATRQDKNGICEYWGRSRTSVKKDRVKAWVGSDRVLYSTSSRLSGELSSSDRYFGSCFPFLRPQLDNTRSPCIERGLHDCPPSMGHEIDESPEAVFHIDFS